MANPTDLLRGYVENIATRIENTEPPWFVPAGASCRFHIQQVISGNESAGLHNEVVTAVGEKALCSFYAGCFNSQQPPIDVCVSSYLWDTVPYFCERSSEDKFVVDRSKLLEELERYREIILAGDMEIVTSLRLANVDIPLDFEFAKGIRFRKISKDDLREKYPVDTNIHGISRFAADTWFEHQVEVVFEDRGKGIDLDKLDQHYHHEAMVNTIIDAFQLSGVQPDRQPFVTHFRCDTPLRSRCDTRSVNLFHKPSLLTEEQIEKLKAAHVVLCKLETDEVLRTAVDRFLLGLNRSSHHPRRLNQPNWDKIVDYVIAMESLFVNASGELSYRLSLNGSSLIHLATKFDRRAVFRALKVLYDLRSKIVHGSSVDFIKAASKFLEALGDRVPERADQFRVYRLLRDKVEEWLRAVVFYLDSTDVARRPYKVANGWEELLWTKPLAE